MYAWAFCVSIRHTSLSRLVIICFWAHWSLAISNDMPYANPQSAPFPCVASIIKSVIVIHTFDGSEDTVRSPSSIPERNLEGKNGKGKLIYKGETKL